MDGRWDRRELLRHGLTVAAAGVAAPWLVAADGAPPHVAGAERGAVGGPLGEVYGRFGAPRGVALTQTADIATTRTVTWLSSGRRDPGSVVRFGAVPAAARGEGIAPSRLTRRTPGTSVIAPFGTFDRDLGESVGPADGEVPVRVHTATMRGLLPGRTYAYQVGTEAGWSPVRTFTTAGSRDEWRFTHVGDHGVTAASRRLNAAVLAREPDLHLFAGDLSYANGRQPVWDRWSQQLEPLAARIPILYAPGNHEAQDFFGETYRRRFARAQQDVAWFGIDVGNVHVTSTTAGAFIAGHNEVAGVRELLLEELSFLERDLADAARRRAAGEIDFLAVLQHFPLFTEERARGPFSPELVLLEEQLLQRYAVDLVLVGHDHGYQRSRPMVGGIPCQAPRLVRMAATRSVRT